MEKITKMDNSYYNQKEVTRGKTGTGTVTFNGSRTLFGDMKHTSRLSNPVKLEFELRWTGNEAQDIKENAKRLAEEIIAFFFKNGLKYEIIIPCGGSFLDREIYSLKHLALKPPTFQGRILMELKNILEKHESILYKVLIKPIPLDDFKYTMKGLDDFIKTIETSVNSLVLLMSDKTCGMLGCTGPNAKYMIKDLLPLKYEEFLRVSDENFKKFNIGLVSNTFKIEDQAQFEIVVPENQLTNLKSPLFWSGNEEEYIREGAEILAEKIIKFLSQYGKYKMIIIPCGGSRVDDESYLLNNLDLKYPTVQGKILIKLKDILKNFNPSILRKILIVPFPFEWDADKKLKFCLNNFSKIIKTYGDPIIFEMSDGISKLRGFTGPAAEKQMKMFPEEYRNFLNTIDENHYKFLSDIEKIISFAEYLTPLDGKIVIGNAYTHKLYEIFTGLLKNAEKQIVLYPFMRTADGKSVYLTYDGGKLTIKIADRKISITENNAIEITGYFSHPYQYKGWKSFGADIIELLTMGELAKLSGCEDLNLSVLDFLKLMSKICIRAKNVFSKEEQAEFINVDLYKTDLFVEFNASYRKNSENSENSVIRIRKQASRFINNIYARELTISFYGDHLIIEGEALDYSKSYEHDSQVAKSLVIKICENGDIFIDEKKLLEYIDKAFNDFQSNKQTKPTSKVSDNPLLLDLPEDFQQYFLTFADNVSALFMVLDYKDTTCRNFNNQMQKFDPVENRWINFEDEDYLPLLFPIKNSDSAFMISDTFKSDGVVYLGKFKIKITNQRVKSIILDYLERERKMASLYKNKGANMANVSKMRTIQIEYGMLEDFLRRINS